MAIQSINNIAGARLNVYCFRSAPAAFDEVLELEPGHGISHIGRFFALAGHGDLAQAGQQIRRAIEWGAIDPAELDFYEALRAQWAGDTARAQTLYNTPATRAQCDREPAFAVLRAVHLGQTDRAVRLVHGMRDTADPNLVVVFGSRNGLDTRRVPAIDAVALALGWRPVAQMLALAQTHDG